MHMTVHDRLTCNLMAVDADVETFDRFVTCKDIGSNLIQEKVDGSPLRLVQVEVSRCVATWDDQSVERRHGEAIPGRYSEFILRNVGLAGMAKHTVLVTSSYALAYLPEVCIVPRSLIGIALVA
jgi:hypothetical protein